MELAEDGMTLTQYGYSAGGELLGLSFYCVRRRCKKTQIIRHLRNVSNRLHKYFVEAFRKKCFLLTFFPIEVLQNN